MPAYTTESSDTGGRRQKVAVVVFVVLAVVANFLPGEAQQQVASALRATVLRPFVVTQEGITEARVRATESGELRARLDSLVAETTGRSTLEEENFRLRSLLSLSERLGQSYRGAAVIRPGTAGSESTFLVDVGAADSIQAWAPVITRHGLLGVVRDVQARSSLGMDWTHPDFRASAITLDGTTSGLVESHRGDFREEDRLVFNGTPFHTTLEEGTVIVTSGLGVYPRGIPIGRVRGLFEADAGWRKSYWLEPFVDPGRVTHVLVASAGSEVGGPLADVGSVWPEDSIVTAEALVRSERTREEARAAMADSLAILRAILAAAGTQDSLRQVVLGDSVPPFERPAPPTASALEQAGGAATVPPGAGPGRTGAAAERERTPPPDEPARAGPPLDTVRIFRPDSLRPISRPVPVPDTTRPDTTRPDTTRPDTTRRVRPDTTRGAARDSDRLRPSRAIPREGGE